MDAIGLLKEDHRAVKALFEQYESLGDEAEVAKRELADRIIRDLSIHAAIEEQFLYPYAKQRDERLAKLVYEALEEHNVAKWELAAVQRLQPSDERFDAKMFVLMENVRHHIREEEEKLLPRLAQTCDRAELDALADALRHAKQIAPTHPHPRAPDAPPGNAMTPVLAAMDRGRDLSRKLMERLRDRARALTRDAGRQAQKAMRKRAPVRTTARRVVKKVVPRVAAAPKRRRARGGPGRKR
ncbi:MAG TPA: hemerythrin domain-containing protein [Myxococcales bacterium]|nr:hemerythrin domain-containing protein [Myxococcales bacterium]